MDIKQCFKCQGYGHLAIACKAKEVCGLCAGDHDTRKCQTGKEKCVNCDRKGLSSNHTATSATCPVRQREKEWVSKKTIYA